MEARRGAVDTGKVDVCPECGKELPKKGTQCECGHVFPVGTRCIRCGFVSVRKHTFCPRCGHYIFRNPWHAIVFLAVFIVLVSWLTYDEEDGLSLIFVVPMVVVWLLSLAYAIKYEWNKHKEGRMDRESNSQAELLDGNRRTEGILASPAENQSSGKGVSPESSEVNLPYSQASQDGEFIGRPWKTGARYSLMVLLTILGIMLGAFIIYIARNQSLPSIPSVTQSWLLFVGGGLTGFIVVMCFGYAHVGHKYGRKMANNIFVALAAVVMIIIVAWVIHISKTS